MTCSASLPKSLSNTLARDKNASIPTTHRSSNATSSSTASFPRLKSWWIHNSHSILNDAAFIRPLRAQKLLSLSQVLGPANEEYGMKDEEFRIRRMIGILTSSFRILHSSSPEH